ncbi:MAG: hypothetical protein M1296_06260, partial [Chloroflexi bacterium]|nr:hypothetical protein [Chloroflexota bacterium]
MSHHRFHQGYVIDGGGGILTQTLSYEDGTQYGDSPDLEGKPYEEDQHDGAGAVLSSKRSTWSATSLSTGSTFVHLDRATEYLGTKRSTTTYAYDPVNQNGTQFGNLTDVYEWGEADPASGLWYRHTRTGYFPRADATAYIVNKPAFVNVYENNGSNVDGDWKSSTWYLYDGHMGWGDQPGSRGLLTAVRRNLGGNQLSDVTYAYDSYGNSTEAAQHAQYGDPYAFGVTPYTTTIQYDTTYHTFPTITTNPVSDQETTTYDPGTGKLLSKTDANNATWSYSYDTFGRITDVRNPLEAPTDAATVKYAYDTTTVPYRITTQRRKDDGGSSTAEYFTTRQFFDGLGRLVQEYSDTVNGVSLKNVHYDNRGLKAWETVPRLVQGTSGAFESVDWNKTDKPMTRYTYDALGRPRFIYNPDGTTYKETSYDPNAWAWASVDENRHARRYENDAFGRLVTVREYTGTSYPWTEYAATTYSYDHLNNLTLVVDAAGNRTTMSYDKIGRKVDMVDPDMGHWLYTYDAQGNLKTQTDAKNQVITFSYDLIDRLTKKESPLGTTLASYAYDVDNGDANSSAIGHRTSMTDTSGSTRWYYDKNGRLSKEIKTIDGVEYPTTYTYNAMDQARTVAYPDGEVVTNSYDFATRLYSVVGADRYLNSATHNAQGQIKSLGLSNGAIQTNFGYHGYNAAGMGDSYDAPGGDGPGSFGRLWRINTMASGQTLQELQHRYDAVGNVTNVDDARSGNLGGLMNYSYDHLDRLVSASPDITSTNGYTEAYTYDAIGNIDSKTQGSSTTSYSYDPSHVHAASGTATSAGTLFADGFANLGNWDTYEGSWTVQSGAMSGTAVASSYAFDTYSYDWSPLSGSWTANHDGTYSGSPNPVSESFSYGSSNWVQDSGYWAVENGEYSNSAGSSWEISHWNAPTGEQLYNYSAEVDASEIGSNSGSLALAFRYKDTGNFYLLQLEANEVRFWRRLGGGWLRMASASFPWYANTTYRLKVVVNGNKMYGYVNGAYYISAEDSTFASGGVALLSVRAHHHFDNVTVRPAAYTLASTPSYGDYVFQAKVQMPDTNYSPNLFFRWQDINNHYWADVFGGGLRIWKKVGGIVYNVASAGGSVSWGGNWHVVRLVLSGSHVQGYIDGALYVDVWDSSFLS